MRMTDTPILFFKAAPTAVTASAAQLDAGNYRKPKRRFQGLLISVENVKGSVRSGTDRDGHPWRIRMANDYGYVRGSLGVDGDNVDCYLGPERDAPTAYIVHQQCPVSLFESKLAQSLRDAWRGDSEVFSKLGDIVSFLEKVGKFGPVKTEFSWRGRIEPAELENLIDGRLAHAKRCGDIPDGMSVVAHLQSLIQIPEARAAVRAAVVGLVRNLKIRQIVIKSVPVNVVDNFLSGKLSTEDALYDYPMFQALFAVVVDEAVKGIPAKLPDMSSPSIGAKHGAATLVSDKRTQHAWVYDECKVMLGFPSEAAAKEAYLKHYDDPRFLGPVTAMPMDEFKRKVLASRHRPRMIKAIPPGTHPEVQVRKDGVTQRYNVANEAPEPAGQGAQDPALTALLKQYAGDAEVSPAEMAEAVRQYREVETRYRGTSGWLKAPNGQPSNLNERQWVLVRTPNFKRWFGDWEGLARQDAMDRFIDRALSEADPRGTMAIRAVTEDEAREVLRLGGPDIRGMLHVLDAQEIKHAFRQHGQADEVLRHPGQRPLTADDIKRVASVLDGYDEMRVQPRGANRTSILYGRHFPDGRVEYVERVFETSAKHKPRLATKTVWVMAATGVESSPARVSTPDHTYSLAFRGGRINQGDVSKVVDANGEPRVVWHGKAGDLEDGAFRVSVQGESGRGVYLTPSAMGAGKWANRSAGFQDNNAQVVLPCFLSLRAPLDTWFNASARPTLLDRLKEIGAPVFLNNVGRMALPQGVDSTEALEDMSRDGVIRRDGSGNVHEFVAFGPEQVKSAIGNAGTFRPDLGHLNKAMPPPKHAKPTDPNPAYRGSADPSQAYRGSADPSPAYRDAIRKKLADLAVMQRQIAATDRKISEAAQDRLKVVQREIDEVSQKAYGDDNAGAKYRDLLTERGRLHRLLS